MNVRTLQNLKFIALPIPEMGVLKKWAVPGYAHALFLPNFPWAFVRMDPVNVPAKFAVRIYLFPFLRYIDCSFGLRLRTPNLGEGEAVGGRGWYRSKDVGEFL